MPDDFLGGQPRTQRIDERITMGTGRTHGLSCTNGKQTKLSFVYAEMRKRCLNPKNKRFDRYGGRGIEVCSEWANYEAFYDWAIRSGYVPGMWLDRIDNDLGYFPLNCRWVTPRESGRNRGYVKVSMEDATKIRSLFLSGAKRSDLASMYGGSWTHIERICKNRNWN